MAEFNIRTDSVDVEQIMRQIRARIKEKRGVDYTEQQIQELAGVKLERFLDPKGVRSDLVEQFKRTRGTSPEPPNYAFEDTTLYETHRGFIRLMRKLFNPLLKMMFNPNPIVHVLHMQGQINNINSQQFRVREELDALYYEVIHNLVLEVTRLGIESKNLKMRLESLSSRLDFDERRARALEGAVQFKAAAAATPAMPAPVARAAEPPRYQPASAKGYGEAGPSARGYGEAGRSQPSYPSAAPRSEPAPSRSSEAVPASTSPAAQGGSEPAGAPGEPLANAATDPSTGTARRRRRRRRGRRGGRGRGPGEGAAVAAGTHPLGDATAGATPGSGASSDAEASAGHAPQADYYDSEAHGSDSGPDSGDEEGPEPTEQ
jgi:hypothetical protein